MNTKNSPRRFSRRKFVAATASSIALFSIVPRHVLGGPRFVPPSEKINVAIIGAGGQGRTLSRALFNEADAQIIAVADPNEHADYKRFYYGGVAGRKPVRAEIEKHYSAKTPNFKCAEYEDFRVMLEKEKGIDAVVCATPDHSHAVICIEAMRAGKHVYCEKPLTHSVWEARQVAKVTRETGVATQMGNQGHSSEEIRATCEWIWDGAIGPVHEVHAWSDAGRWVVGSGRPQERIPEPEGMNWDLWLGPREPRPYHPDYAPFTWRGWWAFGGGALGDMGAHNLDAAVWALDLTHPLTIEGSSPGLDSEIVPYCALYRYQFPARGNQPPVRVNWYDGGLRPPTPPEVREGEQLEGGGNGLYFAGEKGIISCAGWGGAPRIFPTSLMESYRRPPAKIPRSKGHYRDWLDACKGGPPASSNFEYGARLTEIIHLGNVALRARKRLEWDGPNLRAANAPEADQFIKGNYRPGWEIT
jgi:predicted dehydrogenase